MNKNLSRALSSAGLIFLMISALVSCKKNLKAGGSGATIPRAVAYQLVWADEFNGTSLNTSNWNVDVGNPGVNSEQEYYQASNIVETGGNLVITARNQSVSGQPYTSGKIETYGKFSTTYGRIEARMALPMVQGMWPAFWMLGNSINTGTSWPNCGEIDIMEQVNTNNTILGTMHWFNNGNAQYGSCVPTDNTPGNFHIYAVEWTPESISWYVDDSLYVTGNITINNTGAFQDPFYIIFNLAVGGTLSGPTVNTGALPTNMLVDYVHVYNITSAAPPVGQVITLKGSNGLYVTSNNAEADSAMQCDRATASTWEQFTVGDAGNGLITLKGSNGLYVTSNNATADSAMQCNRATAQAWEQFRWITNSNGTITLQGTNGDYVTSNNGAADSAMQCNRLQAQGWEQFNYSIVN